MATQQPLSVTFAGIACRCPLQEAKNLQAAGLPIPPDFYRANSFVNPLGQSPAKGWVILLRSELNAIDLDALHTLTMTDNAGRRVSIANLLIAREPVALTPSFSANDANAAYLVEVADARHRVSNPIYRVAVNKQYNVRSYAFNGASSNTSFLTSTLVASSTPYTWQQLVTNLAIVISSSLSLNSTLPFTPDGTPENWIFIGTDAWEALCKVLWRIGCAVRFKGTTGTYDIVQIGAADTTADAALVLARNQSRQLHDAEYLPIIRGRAPYGCKVFFHRREKFGGTEETSPRTSSQWQTQEPYSVSVDGAASITAKAEAGTYTPLWDDLPAIYDETGTLTNSAALATRAAERTADYYRMILGNGGNRQHKTFSGILAVDPGSTIKGVAWRQAADRAGTPGLVTEVVRHPWAMLRADEGGQFAECTDTESISIQPPQFGPSWTWNQFRDPIIEIATGAPSIGLYDCRVQKSDGVGSTMADKESVWGMDMDLLTTATATLSGRFDARLVGYVSGRPLYAFKVSTSSAGGSISDSTITGGNTITVASITFGGSNTINIDNSTLTINGATTIGGNSTYTYNGDTITYNGAVTIGGSPTVNMTGTPSIKLDGCPSINLGGNPSFGITGSGTFKFDTGIIVGIVGNSPTFSLTVPLVFTGNPLVFPAPTTGYPSLNFPVGVAPTTPALGDVFIGADSIPQIGIGGGLTALLGSSEPNAYETNGGTLPAVYMAGTPGSLSGDNAFGANVLWGVPFTFKQTLTLVKVQVHIGSVGWSAGEKYRIGMYAADAVGGVLPATPIWDSGDQVYSAAGYFSITVNKPGTAGKRYWFTFMTNSATGQFGCWVSNSTFLGETLGYFNGAWSGTSPFVAINNTQTYGAMPNPFPLGSLGIVAAGLTLVPAIGLRFY